MCLGDLSFDPDAYIDSNHPKKSCADKTKKRDNKVQDYTKLMVSFGAILSAHHGFMLPDY